MDLTLRVIRYQNLPPQRVMHFAIGGGGGRIGRNPNNDVVLPDPERWVSGFHAEIRFRNGHYYLLDASSNGTFVNGSGHRLPQGQEVELHDGDEVVIGAYELQVAIAAEEDTEQTGILHRPLMSQDKFDPFDQQRPDVDRNDGVLEGPAPPDILDLVPDGVHEPQSLPQMPDPAAGSPADPRSIPEGADPLQDACEADLISERFVSGARDQAPLGQADHTPQEHAFFNSPEAIPEDFNLLSSEPEPNEPPQSPQTPELAEPPVRSSAPTEAAVGITEALMEEGIAPTGDDKPAHPIPDPGSGNRPGHPIPKQEVRTPLTGSEAGVSGEVDAVAAFLAGLGCDTSTLSAREAPEVMHCAGALLRTLTEGLMAVMMSRASFKSELRIEMTTIRAAENNPFKFSVGVDDALSNLLFRHTKGYLPPVQAAQEALDDVQAHQMAMLAGLRAALQALLGHFDPVMLERKIRAESVMDNLLPMAKKAKAWDRFNAVYAEVSADTADDFMNLFGSIFSSAYEEQVSRLRQGRGGDTR